MKTSLINENFRNINFLSKEYKNIISTIANEIISQVYKFKKDYIKNNKKNNKKIMKMLRIYEKI